MRGRPASIAALLGLLAVGLAAADRHWQTGMWIDHATKRQMVDFGPGSSGFGQPGATPALRAMADVQTYVIETDTLRLELQEVVPIGRDALAATVGKPVTFALDKSTVYVRDAGGVEHALHVTKKTTKQKPS
jgi:hypothetical protein